ncbi:DUF3297 family protein [uncultured Brevundimonas sp.]|jgi:hypothetical protein|uniref:DUF3297 family protein n=1 Tax=uncultured Brevundimonas sp. TaxID=213418 RepID=UPI002610D232|nr:DUF3297 family protein [uncultured Brevundimonas sp.]
MTYTPADFETMTGKQLDAVRAEFEAEGISPVGWSKMRVNDKCRWLKTNLEQFRVAKQAGADLAEIESMGASEYQSNPKTVLALSGSAVGLAAERFADPVLTAPTLPDRLCVDVKSPFFDPIYKQARVWLNGSERKGDVEEYCVSEGWIRARVFDGNGKFVLTDGGAYKTVTLEGEVRVELRERTYQPNRGTAEEQQRRIDAAEAKRARKAERLRKQMGGR